MPLLPFAPAPSSGSASPLTTKGDLFTHSTVDTRLAVGGTDGFLLEADSAQTTGLGWGTHDANLNNKNVVNVAGEVFGTTAFPTTTQNGTNLSQSPILTSNGTYTAVVGGVSGPTYSAWLVNDAITLSDAAGTANPTVYGIGIYPKITSSMGRSDATMIGVAAGPIATGTDTWTLVQGLGLNANIQANVTTVSAINAQVALTTANTITTVTCFKGLTIKLAGTMTTVVGLDLTSLSGGSTTWGMKVANYQSFHQGSFTFGAQTAPTYGIDLQALNGGNTSVIGVAGTSSAPASNPPSNSSWWGLWKGATNYSFVIAFNDAGTMRYTSIGPLQSTSVPTIAKGTSLPA